MGTDITDAAEGFVGAPAVREVIPQEPGTSVRWRVHSYPDPLARWHFHPEYEVHLITAGSGRYIIGDVVGSFGAGHLAIVGANLPHDWISDLSGIKLIPDRDMVLQFSKQWLDKCQSVLPELQDLDKLMGRAAHGIEYLGQTAVRGRHEMELIGSSAGSARIHHIFGLLSVLNDAPDQEQRLLVNNWPGATIDDPRSADVVRGAIEYIFDNITGKVRLSRAARRAQMSDSAFSRYFKAASGQTFSEMVMKLRLNQACRLLENTTDSVSAIAREVGYANLSNFNRQFRSMYGTTPREYRKTH